MSNNLPMKVSNQNKLISNIKTNVTRLFKATGYSALLLGTIVASMSMPALIIPAIPIIGYTSQKVLNNTVFKTYKDIPFVVRKTKKSTNIHQDPYRLDVLRNIHDLSSIEKAGFMQIQAIIGLSRLESQNNKGMPIKYQTDSHGITRKTFKALEKLGYIENYEEEYKKDSKEILPKLAFGNFKGLSEKQKVYTISFQKTSKPIDLEDEKLKKMFPLIFSKRGLIARRNFEITRNKEGNLVMTRNKNKEETGTKTRKKFSKRKLREEMKKDAPTLEEKKAHIEKLREENFFERGNDQNINREERQWKKWLSS